MLRALPVLLLLPSLGSAALAAVFPVVSTEDATDAAPGDGACAAASAACTLRAAVMEANALAGADEIHLPAGTYPLTIEGRNEDAAATGDLDVTDDLAIAGAGPTETVIGGTTCFLFCDRIFDVAPAGSLALAGVTVSGGFAAIDSGSVGGGLRNRGTTSISDCRFEDQEASFDGLGGALYNEGYLRVERSEIVRARVDTGDGGAIGQRGGEVVVVESRLAGNYGEDGGAILASAGDVTVEGSLIEQNIDDAGGAIYFHAGHLRISDTALSENDGSIYLSAGTAELERVRIVNNSASQLAGAIWVDRFASLTLRDSELRGNLGPVGAIGNNGVAHIEGTTIAGNFSEDVVVTNSGTASIANTTISGNLSSFPPFVPRTVSNSGRLGLRNSTIVENAGRGIVSSGLLALANSVVAGNGAGGECAVFGGSLTSAGHNLIGDGTGCVGIDGPTDLAGTSAAPIDPLLEPLAHHGGFALTHRPRLGSPLLDAGSPLAPGSGEGACEATDQRGVARPQNGDTHPGAVCDIGAVEWAKECRDGIDNDGDGVVDWPADRGCRSRYGLAEAPECDDGVDNDGDGAIDWDGGGAGAADPDCRKASGRSEGARA
jgi:hypothetical protein